MAKFTEVEGFERPLTFPDFDRRTLRKGFGDIGREIKREARKLISKKAISKAGGFPARRTGTLAKSLTHRVSRSGFSVGVSSFGGNLDPFYPAFVMYGHRGPGSDMRNGKADRRQRGKTRVGKKVAAPRQNWIVVAADRYAETKYMAQLKAMLDDAIKPGLIQDAITK